MNASSPLDPRALRRWLLGAIAVVAGAGLAIEVAYELIRSPLVAALAPQLSLSGEGNVPTWVSSMLLAACALAAGAIARALAVGTTLRFDPERTSAPELLRALGQATDAHRAMRRGWWGVCAVFAYASLDECAQLHEHLGGHLPTRGVLYFDWVIPAVAIVVVLAVVFWPFVRALPVATRRALVVAGAIYLGGAIVMELPLGWWTDRHGATGLGYALIDWVEETLELIGAALALVGLVAHQDAP